MVDKINLSLLSTILENIRKRCAHYSYLRIYDVIPKSRVFALSLRPPAGATCQFTTDSSVIFERLIYTALDITKIGLSFSENKAF